MSWTRPLTDESLLAQADLDQAALDARMRAVAIDDGPPVAVFDEGQGDAIVLLPMISDLNFLYAPQIAEFLPDHRVVLYRPRLSDRTRVEIADRASEALAVMRQLGIAWAHIIVWGDTGTAAYQIAKEYSDRVRSIVFIGLADRYVFPQPYRFLLWVLACLPIERLVPSSVFATILARAIGGTQIKPRWFAERARRVPRLARLFKCSIVPNLVDHRPKRGEVRVPCLVINGDRDRVVSVPQARRMAGLLANVHRIAIIPGGEHFVSYVDGDTVNGLIREFYASLQ